MSSKPARIGIITVSDRASRGEYKDLGGPAIHQVLSRMLASSWEAVERVIPDDQPVIEQTLKDLADKETCSLIVTTGGTGPAKRDVTPEATEAVSEKLMPGFGELMRQVSLKFVPTAILSRQTAGIRGKCLILNLPGKPSAIKDCLEAVFPAVPYCIDLIDGAYLETDESVCKAFRPKQI
ncbi:molybdopterin adenylyltransferase [Kiloniella laminariae]|uniref:molybdopterin adenylyltransferase n=1 Tax=Kiloniella laminariae TaxID=454162 RepID=UPI00036CEB02|nr:molybdopterin adenylyltransferase [Kiloniella laminariae]